MDHFKEIEFGFINIIFVCIGSNKATTMFFRILRGGTNIGPYCFPPNPHPHAHLHPWRPQTSLARGQNN